MLYRCVRLTSWLLISLIAYYVIFARMTTQQKSNVSAAGIVIIIIIKNNEFHRDASLKQNFRAAGSI